MARIKKRAGKKPAGRGDQRALAERRDEGAGGGASGDLRLRLGMAALVAAAVLAVFSGALGHQFLQWDDTVHTSENPHIADTLYFWLNFEQGMYMPVTFSIWSLLHRAFGPDPFPFHLTNLLLHALNALGVYLVLLMLLVHRPAGSGAALAGEDRAATLGAAAGALLFALHPLQVEPVAWITSLKDLGYSFFSLLCIWAFLRRARTRDNPERFGYLSVAALLLASLCKTSAVSVLLLLALLSVAHLRTPWRRMVRELWPHAAAVLPAVSLNLLSQGRLVQLHHTPLHLRPLVALDSLGFYVGKLLLPVTLLPAYGRSPRSLLASGEIAWSWLPGAAVLLALLLPGVRRRAPRLVLGGGLFVAGVALMLGLTSFAAQDNTTVYDRYVYLALLGPALCLGALVHSCPRTPALVACAALLAACGVLSRQQVRHWRSDETLWTFTLLHRPRDPVALVNLGRVRSRQGRGPESLELYRQAVAADPVDPDAQNNLGAALAEAGQLELAGEHFRRAVAINPQSVAAQNNLSQYLLHKGDLEGAARHARVVLDRAPGHRDAALRLGEVLLRQGDLPGCQALVEGWLHRHSTDAEAFTLLGVVHGRRGQRDLAVRAFRRALSLDPGNKMARMNLDTALGAQKK